MGGNVQVGDRVRLSGGYDMEPKWLDEKQERTGGVVRFIPGQNKVEAAVVELDSPMSFEGLTGKTLVLELRYTGSQ